MNNTNLKIKTFLVALIVGTTGFTYQANAIPVNTVDFAGKTWNVKNGIGGPGAAGIGNNWGDTAQDVFVDGAGLHLKVSKHSDDQKWYSSEVYLPTSLGYGKYTFDINSRVDLLDQNLVAAPFLYQDDTHEIDIEHSYWAGETGTDNLFYTVQPGGKAGNQNKISSTFSDGVFQDIIDWQPDKISFSTIQNGNIINSWVYASSTDGTTNNFNPGSELVHINFWQYKSLEPLNATTSELIVSNFSFVSSTPQTPIVTSTPTLSTSTPNINGFSVSTSTITLSWNPVLDAISYEVSSTATTTIITSSTSTTFSDLTPNTQYNFQIREFNGINYSDFSAVTSTFTSALPVVTNTSTTSTISTSTNSGGGSGGNSSNTPTNQNVSDALINSSVDKLINFIKSNQDSSGKIIDGGTSDWLTMTFAAKNIYATDVKSGTSSLYDYVYNYDNSLLDSELNNCAAYPRHILALLASGVSKNDGKIAALKIKLDNCVQNNKFGQNGINDDVFGLLAAMAIGEDQSAPVVQTTVNTIKANQEADGGFAYPGPFESPDLTGAAINALKYAQTNGVTIDESIFTKAKQYLKSQELTDGGWGYGTSDALTTSWAVMGINALGENQTNWFNSTGKNPWYILTTLDNDHFTQSWDGNVDWFGTKHAVPALLGKSWPIILEPKTAANNVGGGSSTIIPTTSTITTTSTPSTSTTTIAISTTTVAMTTTTIPTPTSSIQTTTTPVLVLENPKPEAKPIILPTKRQNKIVETKKITPTDNNLLTNKPSTHPQEQLSTGQKEKEKNNTIDNLPLDTPTRRTAKKVLAVTGGSAAALGLYLGLRLIKNVI